MTIAPHPQQSWANLKQVGGKYLMWKRDSVKCDINISHFSESRLSCRFHLTNSHIIPKKQNRNGKLICSDVSGKVHDFLTGKCEFPWKTKQNKKQLWCKGRDIFKEVLADITKESQGNQQWCETQLWRKKFWESKQRTLLWAGPKSWVLGGGGVRRGKRRDNLLYMTILIQLGIIYTEKLQSLEISLKSHLQSCF